MRKIFGAIIILLILILASCSKETTPPETPLTNQKLLELYDGPVCFREDTDIIPSEGYKTMYETLDNKEISIIRITDFDKLHDSLSGFEFSLISSIKGELVETDNLGFTTRCKLNPNGDYSLIAHSSSAEEFPIRIGEYYIVFSLLEGNSIAYFGEEVHVTQDWIHLENFDETKDLLNQDDNIISLLQENTAISDILFD